MTDIYYKIARIPQQEEVDCVQAAAAQLLSHYGIAKTVSDVKAEVPVFVDSNGNKLGTSLGHIAAYFVSLGFTTTLHLSDVDLFDQTWRNCSKEELIKNIRARAFKMKHAVYGPDALQAIADGYTLFLDNSGELKMAVVDESYIASLLQSGPVYAVINYQFLYDKPKYRFHESALLDDPIGGVPSTHAVLIVGYREGAFCILNPNAEFQEAEQWIPAGKVVGAYYLADLNIDPLLITLQTGPNGSDGKN